MKKILILSACMLCYGGIFAQDKKVAVFDPAGSVNEGVKEIIREEISNIIVNTRGYSVLERQLINKVLEENKFQMGGLVDNSQIGEIGKKMGANAVFVTSVTPTGSNLYISLKLIDVQTARIEKQKTGITTRGENDVVAVVQRTVSEMLGEASAASVGETQPARVVPATPRPPQSGALTADGIDIFSKGRELSRKEVRTLLMNTDALRLYNKGVSRRRAGNAMLWSGIGIAALGGITTSLGDSYGLDDTEITAISIIGILGGGGLILTGITFKIAGRFPIKKAVKSYNSLQLSSTTSYTPELRFGFTEHGAGLVYRF